MFAKVLAAAALLAVCFACTTTTTPTGWQKSGAYLSDVERDRSQCANEAKAASPGSGGAERQAELVGTCMKARGYVPR